MSTINLLNLNVDALFEQHNVPEIDIIQKKIQSVVENKREELRTMVGERYRDLLQAADTIASMQTSAGTLITQIEQITTNCRSLNEQQLIGFKSNDTTGMLRQRNANKELNNYFSTMIQIKLLTSLPEMIWSQIDQEHFYAATELFIFSRHISTGLQLDAKNDLMQHLPVAKKQWEILKPFHLTIKQSVMAVLEREELSAEVASDCLLSLLLLEKSSFNSAIKNFLQLRCTAFLACLSESAVGADTELRRVKERILASLNVLNGTMLLLSKCILENGLLFKKLADHADPQASPTISLTDEAQYAHLLPEIISNFRPKFDVQTLDKAQVTVSIEQFLSDAKRIAGVQLKNLFKLVTNMSTIQAIKTKANEFKKELNFEPFAKHFDLKQSLDFYDCEYVPLINQRIRDIIQNSWTLAMNATFDAIEEVLPSTNDVVEHNFWQEQPNDLPQSLEIALSDDCRQKSLLMKTKGYDADILRICIEFDEQLAAIIAEMNVLLEEETTKSVDKHALIEFLRQTSQNQWHDFLTKLKQLNLGPEQRRQLLFIMRMCLALVELCPQLKICFCQQASWRQWSTGSGQQVTAGLEHWQRICSLLEDEIQRFWIQILDGILAEHNCTHAMPTNLGYNVMLEDFVPWETVTLEQKDEQDNTITSNFRIPCQPRISLQTFLFNLKKYIYSPILPMVLPVKLVHAAVHKILSQLLPHYQSLAKDATMSSNQSIALQHYFDLKFLQSLFQITREERDLYEQFQRLQAEFKEFVDPFDFELFDEHITNNVKRSVASLSSELGILLSVGTQTTSVTQTQEKDPNILGLTTNASTTVWFPLLPIVTEHANRGSVGLSGKKQSSTTTATGANTTTAITTPTRKSSSRKSNNDAGQKTKSGATSFFGAMSQEWFR